MTCGLFRTLRRPFFFAACEHDDACMGISKDPMEGRERAKAREAVCIIELQGSRHREKVPKCKATNSYGNPINKGSERCHTHFFTHSIARRPENIISHHVAYVLQHKSDICSDEPGEAVSIGGVKLR